MIGSLSSGKGYIQQQRFDGTATAYDLAIQPNGGNVGIGTESPSQKLHVAGNIYAASGFVNSSGYQLNGTYIVDSSRNLVNIVDATINGEVGIGTTPSSTWKTIIQSQYPLQLKSNTIRH
jgi:hypothetical protein